MLKTINLDAPVSSSTAQISKSFSLQFCKISATSGLFPWNSHYWKLIIYSTLKVKFTLQPGIKADRGSRSTHCLILMLGGGGGNSMPWLFYP
jgi:hypothetical protein